MTSSGTFGFICVVEKVLRVKVSRLQNEKKLQEIG